MRDEEEEEEEDCPCLENTAQGDAHTQVATTTFTAPLPLPTACPNITSR